MAATRAAGREHFDSSGRNFAIGSRAD
jgi:hypothetical protein